MPPASGTSSRACDRRPRMPTSVVLNGTTSIGACGAVARLVYGEIRVAICRHSGRTRIRSRAYRATDSTSGASPADRTRPPIGWPVSRSNAGPSRFPRTVGGWHSRSRDRRAATRGSKHYVVVYDAATGLTRHQFEVPGTWSPDVLRISPGGRYLTASSYQRVIGNNPIVIRTDMDYNEVSVALWDIFRGERVSASPSGPGTVRPRREMNRRSDPCRFRPTNPISRSATNRGSSTCSLRRLARAEHSPRRRTAEVISASSVAWPSHRTAGLSRRPTDYSACITRGV